LYWSVKNLLPVTNSPPVSAANHDIVPAGLLHNRDDPSSCPRSDLFPLWWLLAAAFTNEALLNRIRLEQELVAKFVIVMMVLPEFASTTVVKDPVPAVVALVLLYFL
jgi:hypothetical protein